MEVRLTDPHPNWLVASRKSHALKLQPEGLNPWAPDSENINLLGRLVFVGHEELLVVADFKSGDEITSWRVRRFPFSHPIDHAEQ